MALNVMYLPRTFASTARLVRTVLGLVVTVVARALDHMPPISGNMMERGGASSARLGQSLGRPSSRFAMSRARTGVSIDPEGVLNR